MHLSDLWVYILLCSSRIPAGWLCTWGHTVHNAVERVGSEKSQSSRENSAGLLLCYNIQQSSPRVCMDTNISKWSVNFFKIKQRFQQTGSISKMFVYWESKVEPEEMFLLFFIQSCWISRLAFVLLVCSEKLTRKHQYEWWEVLNDLQMCEKGYCEQNSHICIVMVALWFTCWKPFFSFVQYVFR